MENDYIVCEHVSKVYMVGKERVEVLRDISFTVKRNEFVAVVGPMGCGKTTLINIISGIERPTSGKVLIDGKECVGVQKNMALVFQEIGIFPWRTVLENVAFGLEIRGVEKKKRLEIARKYIEVVGLKGFENYYPSQLSGGMQQRVSIARAYAINPDVLLMDEPFGHLDAQTRWYMEQELLKIWSMYKKTVILSTSLIDEAIYLSNKIVVLTKRPSEVKEVIYVNVPKDRLNPEFLNLKEKVEKLIEPTII